MTSQLKITPNCVDNFIESCDSDDTPTAPEYEFDSSSETDENGWDDLDLIQQNEYLCIAPFHKKSNKYEECWQCIECYTINNVQLSIRKYNRKCCGCQQSFYIENQTEIIYSSQWETINDFIFKSWPCTQCTFINHDHLSNLCEICQSQRPIITDHITTDIIVDPHELINKNGNEITPWICPKCNGMETQNDVKCEKCDCKKPIKRIINFTIDLISGFCRKYFYHKIPDEIEKILNDYYKLQTFSCSLKSHLTSYHNQYAVTSLIGDEYIQYPQKNKWILQLKIDNDGIYMSDICIFDIEIGVIADNKKKYTMTGNGRNNNQYPAFKKHDVITVELDCECGTLSFGINNNWYGIECDDLSLTTRYRLYLLIKQEGVIIHLID